MRIIIILCWSIISHYINIKEHKTTAIQFYQDKCMIENKWNFLKVCIVNGGQRAIFCQNVNVHLCTCYD